MRKLQWISIVLLIAGAAGLGWKLRNDWHTFHAANDPASLKTRPLAAAPVPTAMAAPDYTIVAQQNPFHPERNDALPPPPPVVQKAQGPPPLVYGSMLMGKEKFALMGTESDPKPRKVVEGEEFQGYKLAEVKQQSVILEADGAKSEVMLYNALSRLRREQAQRTAQPPTASTAGGATATTVTASAPGATAPILDSGPQLPLAAPGTPPPPGKTLTLTPFGYMWQDKKQ